MVDLWVLHIHSLRQTFDQSLMKIFQRVQEIWCGQESVTEGQMGGQTDGQTEAISIIPHPLRCGGLTTTDNTLKYFFLFEIFIFIFSRENKIISKVNHLPIDHSDGMSSLNLSEKNNKINFRVSPAGT